MPLPEEVDIVNDYLKKKSKQKSPENDAEQKLFDFKKKGMIEKKEVPVKKGLISVFSGIFSRKQTEPKIVVQTKENIRPPSRKDELLQSNNDEFKKSFQKSMNQKPSSDIEMVQSIPNSLKKEVQENEMKRKPQNQDTSGEVVFLDHQEAVIKQQVKIVEAKPAVQEHDEMNEEREAAEEKIEAEKQITSEEETPNHEVNDQDIMDLLGEENPPIKEDPKVEAKRPDNGAKAFAESEMSKYRELMKQRELPLPRQQELEMPNLQGKKPFLGPVFPEKKPLDETRKQLLKSLKDLVDPENKQE